MCKDLDLSILNGRMIGDVYGNLTCYHHNGCSVVDYEICSNALLQSVTQFKVECLLPTLSDHCSIGVSISTNLNFDSQRVPSLHASQSMTYFPWSDMIENDLCLALQTEIA